jgi:hypothetical protein
VSQGNFTNIITDEETQRHSDKNRQSKFEQWIQLDIAGSICKWDNYQRMDKVDGIGAGRYRLSHLSLYIEALAKQE